MANTDICDYNNALAEPYKQICDNLQKEIDANLVQSTCKIWHKNPVWFLDGNPVVGYAKLKDCVQLLFWSGQTFDEAKLVSEGNFKAAQVRFTKAEEINKNDLRAWLQKATNIQWDYKNIVKNKGKLTRIK